MLRFLIVPALIFAGAGTPLAQQHSGSTVVLGKSVDTIPMAEWEIVAQGRAEQTGARVLIASGPAEIEKAPPNAARYDSRTYKFPTGQIRLLKFSKDKGGVIHQITFETALFVLKGSATVGVGGKDVEIGAGDAVSLPSGVLRSKPNAAEDSEFILFTVGNAKPDAKAAVVRAKDVKAEPPRGAAEGPKITMRRYNYEGNSVRVAQLTGTGRTAPNTPPDDVLVYVTAGRLRVTIGDEVHEVGAGDALREVAGTPTRWEVLEDATLVATSAPSIISAKPKK